MAQVIAATKAVKAGYVSSKYICVQVTEVDQGGGSMMDRITACMNSQCLSVWEAWQEWKSEPPQQTNFPHKTACPKSDTSLHEAT
jgi:hypothetical protein